VRRASQKGSALLIAMIVLAVLGFAAAAISVSVSTSANVSLQAATWQESIMAAEAGADTAMASFRAALDEGTKWNLSANALSDTKAGATAWSSWSVDDSYVLSGVTIPTKVSLSPVFRAASGGITGMQSKVTIEAPTAAAWTTSSGQWYRIRSTGIAGIAGPARVGMDKRDSDLRKISLVLTRASRSGYPIPTSLGTAAVTRSVELIIKPLPRGLWDRAISAAGPINSGAKFVVDSYDSTDSAKSTSGHYDASKLHVAPNFYGNNADVASNDIGSHVKIGDANVYGDLAYNTGTATGTTNVTGAITNNYYQQLVDISAPQWATYNNTPAAITKVSYTLAGGSQASPARYILSDITLQTGNVLTFQDTGAGKYIEIYATKDVQLSQNGQIIVPDGFNVKFYITGKFTNSGGAMVNQTTGANAAAALSLYGIATANGSTPLWAYSSDSDFTGTIYGTYVEFKVTGVANFYGAVVVNTVDFGGGVGAGFHFDEALLKGGGNGTPRYQVASWVEDVR
jgi:hypothetical protein